MGKPLGKHLDFSKRQVIFNCLENCATAIEIAALVNLHPTSISREIKKRRTYKPGNVGDTSICVDCANKKACHIRHNCKNQCTKICLRCRTMSHCARKVTFTCKKEVSRRFPFVCNGCDKKEVCPLDKYMYYPSVADNEYRKLLSTSRQGIDKSPESFQHINNQVRDGVNKGQSIYHIAHTLNGEAKVSVSTLYRYIHNEYLTITVHDLPKVVTLKKRTKKLPSQYEYKENKGLDRTGHLYKDWIIFQAKNRIVTYWQMDFLGVPHCSSKMILALTISQIQFVCLYIIKKPDNDKVLEIIDQIETELGIDDFCKLFEAVLTDRDSKFSDIKKFEINESGIKRTSLFFCDSGASNQKPNIENINSQLRLYIDKKADISDATQEQCYELSSHLNSRLLGSLGASSPIDAFIELFGEEILHKLHQRKIEPKDVAPKNIIATK